MAATGGKGFTHVAGNIAAATNTIVIVAPDASMGPGTIYLCSLHLSVGTAWTTGRLRVEDGQGGAVIARMATVTADAQYDAVYFNASKGHEFPGLPLTPGNGLNINTSGTPGAVDYYIVYCIR